MTKGLIRNVGTLAAGQSISLLVPILAIPFIASKLDIESFATAMALMSILQFGYIFCEFGSNIIGPEALNTEPNSESVAKIGTNMFLGRIIVQLAYLCLVFLLFTDAKLHFAAFAIVSMSLFFYTMQPIWLFTANQHFTSLTIMTLAGKGVYLVYIFPALYFYPKIEVALLAGVLGNLTTLALMLLKKSYRNSFSFRQVSIKSVLTFLKNGFKILLSRVFLNFHFYLGVPFIIQWIGEVQAASYAAAETVAKAVRGGMGTASQAAFPYFMKNRDTVIFFRFLALAVAASIILGFLIAFMAPTIHDVLFANQFENFDQISRMFAFLVPISIINQLLGYPAFAMVRNRNLVDQTSFLMPTMTIAFILILLPVVGEFSVLVWLWSVFAAECILLLTKAILFQRELKKFLRVGY